MAGPGKKCESQFFPRAARNCVRSAAKSANRRVKEGQREALLPGNHVQPGPIEVKLSPGHLSDVNPDDVVFG